MRRYKSFGDFSHRGNYLSKDGVDFALILDSKRFDAVKTLEKAMLQHLTYITEVSNIELCLPLEGFSLAEQLRLLESAYTQKFIKSILLPEYTSQSDRITILGKSSLPVRLLEVEVSIVEDIKSLREFTNLKSISSSLPLRLGASLRDLGEGPEPPQIQDEDIPEVRWTTRVVQTFIEIIHGTS